MPLTQTQLAIAVADRAELSKTDAKRALAALEEVVLEQRRQRREGTDRGDGAAGRPRQAGAEEAHGP